MFRIMTRGLSFARRRSESIKKIRAIQQRHPLLSPTKVQDPQQLQEIVAFD